MPDHTTTSAAEYLAARGYTVEGGGRIAGRHLPKADTIRRMILSGRLPARRVGYVWLIGQEELDKLIEARSAK